ncbi:GAF domain-containing protein [Nocardioides mangrovicus]|uniref:GAF domain-containing protein n=2 Tax=Nocardioides mangrovicus TaxID=2478913 RepID=A0A3L8P1G4_9ACTN|nr:GAF domain-containing protein [Nocardioides mangrovicus]
MPPGTDPQELSRLLALAHDAFVDCGDPGSAVRQLVLDSWRRSVASGLDPELAQAPIRLDDEELAAIREAHPLTSVMPVIRRLLVESAADAGLLVAVSDAAGQLLYVEGSSSLRSRAESMNFLPGADWSEAVAGTNAPGTALALERPVQIFAGEHLSRQVTPWSCSAAPIHDPDSRAMLGVLDVTGSAEVATPYALQLVRATAAAAEAELRIARLSGARAHVAVSPGWSAPRLGVLGRNAAVVEHSGSTSRLSLRHSEVLLVLAGARDGLSTAQLALALSEDDQAAVTVRAEVSRLRQILAGLTGGPELASRPYRLTAALPTDVEEVRSALRAGQLRRAVAAYPGPVLPSSVAPGVVEIRDALHAEVRSAVLAATDADAVLSFADTGHGRDDYEVWQHALQVLPASSPRYAQVSGHVERLDLELG